MTIADLIDDLPRTELELAAALIRYGSVVWQGEVWWVRSVPRMSLVSHAAVARADDCPWPPRPTPVPDESAGFISDHEMNR